MATLLGVSQIECISFLISSSSDQLISQLKHKPNLGEGCVINFCAIENQMFWPLSDKPHNKGIVENCCDGGISIVECPTNRKEEYDSDLQMDSV